MKSTTNNSSDQAERNGKTISAFQEHYISCPICQDIEPHYAFKPRLYVERERDIDMRPTQLQWSVRGFEKYHPSLYYIFHCKQCHFAAGSNHYKDPLGEAGISIKKFRAAIKDAHENDPAVRKVLKLLGDVVPDLREIGFFDAIRLHLLAIFNFLLVPDAVNNDSLNLGRYCNRLAWLYRDLSERPEELQAVGPKLSRLIEKLRGYWPEIPASEIAAQELSVAFYERALTHSSAVKSSKNEIEIILLIARIYLKLDDIRNTRRYLSTAREKLRKLDEIDHLAARGEVQETDAERVQRHADSRILSRALDELTGIYSDVQQELEHAQVERGLIFAKALDTKSPVDIHKRMAESGFDEAIITKVCDLLSKREPKGLFGLFS